MKKFYEKKMKLNKKIRAKNYENLTRKENSID